MMQRIPEPELMDDPAQAQAYAEADFAEPHEAFVDHFAQRFPWFAGGEVLDLGCGPADVTLRFARRYGAARILGIDGAAAMLALARAATARAGLSERVRFQELRLPSDALPAGAFDAVISNSLLHHLHEPSVLWRAIMHAARPGACVLVMDLLRPDSPAAAAALVARYAAAAPPVLRQDFFNSLLAAYRPDEIRAQWACCGLGGMQIEVVSDRHWLAWGML